MITLNVHWQSKHFWMELSYNHKYKDIDMQLPGLPGLVSPHEYIATNFSSFSLVSEISVLHNKDEVSEISVLHTQRLIT